MNKNIFYKVSTCFLFLLALGTSHQYVYGMQQNNQAPLHNPIVEEIVSLKTKLARVYRRRFYNAYDSKIVSKLEAATRIRIQKHIDENPKLIDAQHSNGVTPLVEAATLLNIASFILDLGANPNGTDTLKSTSLIYAAKDMNPSAISLLLSKGANANLRNKHNQCAADYVSTAAWLDKAKRHQSLQLLLAAMPAQEAASYFAKHSITPI